MLHASNIHGISVFKHFIAVQGSRNVI